MRKLFALLILVTFCHSAFAQQPKQVQLVSSQLLKGLQERGLVRIIKPIFSHEGSTLAADSANFNQSANTFDAFGNVVITQSNGTSVYSDLLNYNGNTKLAILTRNVRLVDGDATLTTEFLTYNMGTKIGSYSGGGKIVNAQNTITSKRGYYFANSRDAYFKNNVIVNSPDALIKSDTLRYNTTSKIAYFYGPTYIYGKDDTLYTENGQYDTSNDQARFGKKNLYTQGSKSLKGDSLFYDRRAGYGRAIKNITFVDAAEKITFKGDMGVYNKADQSIVATKNAYVIITSESDSSKVDSIYMTADTLYSKMVLKRSVKPYRKDELKKDNELEEPENAEAYKEGDTKPSDKPEKISAVKPKPTRKSKKGKKEIEEPKVEVALKTDSVEAKAAVDTVAPPPLPVVLKPEKAPVDSVKTKLSKKDAKKLATTKPKAKPVPVIADSTLKDTARIRIVMAFHHAKIFKSDLQAKSDSMFFSYGDSTVRCYVDPMIWTQGSQLTGDTIYLQLKNKKLDNMLLQHNSFIVNTDDGDSTHFNQVRGKVITGLFKDSKLDRMFVDGNAESIYFVKDDSTYSGMNRMVSSRIKIIFEKSKLRDIVSIRSPEGNYYPIDKIPTDEDILKGFIWKPKDRPKSKEQIIPTLVKSKTTPKAKAAPKKVVKRKTTPARKN
ncbi:MAG: OstA-like protein [Daejeonella sp.]